MPSAIELLGMSKSYGRRVGVSGLSFEVPQGALYGFLGPNGSGKTTTIRVLMGFMRPNAGRVRVLDRDCWDDSSRIKAEVGYLPGDVRLHPWLTALSGLAVVSAGRGRDLTGHGRELIDLFELDPDVPAHKMSRGMRQKLGLVLALAHAPAVLILDEPTASLDPIMQSRLYSYLRHAALGGRTVFLSSHTLTEVESLCDRVAILRQGRIVAEDSIEHLRTRAGRMAGLTWRSEVDAAAAMLPGGLEVRSQLGRQWECRFRGEPIDFVRWCASQPLVDVSLGRPDLTEVFRRYYE